jgi:glycosyltransferase involved in cell wall biosynthesis
MPLRSTGSKRLLFVLNNAEFFLSHRVPIAEAARRAGYEVAVATPQGDGVEEVRARGFQHYAFPLSRGGTNPLKDAGTVLALVSLLRKAKPSIVHAVAIKAVAYAGIATRMARVPSLVCAVTGLGYAFISDRAIARMTRRLVMGLLRTSFAHPNCGVIFQNDDDRQLISASTGLRADKAVMIRGSGVDLAKFAATDEPLGMPVVMLPARMLHDKGVPEFVEAARLLRSDGLRARFVLVGAVDPANPASLEEVTLRRWQSEEVVECWGPRRDMPAALQSANVVVLPSHREGLPKVLLEAAASARAVVTTDVPGCRDAIEPGRSGLLVPPRQPRALADAIAILVRDADRRRAMGLAGRALAERQFSVERVVDAHLALYAELTAAAARRTGAAGSATARDARATP